MSTRATIVIKDNFDTLYFYRHSDGYPEVTGEDLKEFILGYSTGMRNNASQSAGWLIIRGHNAYNKQGYSKPTPSLVDRFSGWKVGAYEPISRPAGDSEYIYTIDLIKGLLSWKEDNKIVTIPFKMEGQ